MSSSSSYSNSNSNPQAGVGVYDVFLSFRGEDTRNGFTNYLYDALTREGIKTFFDDDNLARGKAISEGLMKAIQGSRSSIVVLSENYAFSSWCLTELCKIVECMDTSGLIVLPIFYHVNPSHVRKVIGSYRDAFNRHENNAKLDIEDVESWRASLKKVGNLAGWTLQDTDVEAKFIKGFVAEISSLLDIRKESPHEVYFDQSLVSKMVNPANAPSLVGKFLDEERSEDFIKDYILPIRSVLPVEELVKECEKRNRLVLLSQLLEQLVNEGSQDVHVHNALGKIIINSNNNPEHFLTTNLCYDSRVVGKHCEIRDHPTLAVVAYRRGHCDDELINVTNKNSLFQLQARYVVERMDGKLWEKVLDPKNEYRRQLIDQVVSTALPESKSPDEVSAAIKAFNRFDCFEGPEIAKVAVNVQLYEEAFSMYEKLNLNVEAVNVLLDNIQSIDRAVEFAYRIEEVDVWKQVRKAQPAAGDVSVHHNHHLVNEPVDFDRSLERKRDHPVSETSHYRNPNNNPQKVVPNTRGSKALAILKTHFQDSYGPRKTLFVVVFESKISSWFTRLSSKPSVSFPVERKWYLDWNLKGLAICVCFRPYSSNTLTCQMTLQVSHRCSYTVPIGGHRCQPECGKSNSFYHIWMMYVPIHSLPKFNNVSSKVEISFHNELLDDGWCFGQCGIRLVYKKDIKDLNQINESPNVQVTDFIQTVPPIPDRLKYLSHPHSSKMLDPRDDYDDSDEESEDWHEGVDDLDMGSKVLKEHFQDRSGPMKSLDAVVFGRKVPSWFTISSSEPSSTELKRDWCGSNLMGLAACVCFRPHTSNTLYCRMTFDKSMIQIGEHNCQPGCGKSNTFRIWMIYLPRSDLPDQLFKMVSGNIDISFCNKLLDDDDCFGQGRMRLVYKKDIKELKSN